MSKAMGGDGVGGEEEEHNVDLEAVAMSRSFVVGRGWSPAALSMRRLSCLPVQDDGHG